MPITAGLVRCASKARGLGKIRVASDGKDADIILGKDAQYREIKSKADEQEIARLGQSAKYVVVNARDWKIIPRSDSEKLNFNLITDYASQDTVAAFVRANKLTPLVFIGNPSFATLINYGILKSVSIPIKFRGKTLIPMEVDGLV